MGMRDFPLSQQSLCYCLPTGAAYGLQLTLNVEHYEYVQGFSDDTGVKVG